MIKGLKPYPTWVCHECATQAGGYIPVGHIGTFHTGRYGVCGKIKTVTEPRDYGYPKFEGYKE